jgi:hypothetical protein
LNKQNSFAAVITTINPPNEGMNSLLDFGKTVSAPVIVVGDTKTPNSWENTDFEYLSIATQTDLFGSFSELIPTRHYARKNLGYLRARSHGVEWIYETDDDNVPTQSPFKNRHLNLDAEVYESDSKWLNIYEVFGYTSQEDAPPLIWPRGFDLRSLKLPTIKSGTRQVSAPLQQGLANGDPDVDAIYRLVLGNFVDFKESNPVALAKTQICPTNSQTTWWHSSIHQLMYLPSTCTFRLTDILRGFVAWRILQDRNETVSFHTPIVRQDRNEHDLLRDFGDETELYLHSDNLVSDLVELNLTQLSTSQKLIACYEAFVKRGVVGESEIELIQGWNSHF